MGREKRVPITPSVLRWAIEESGFTTAALAERLKTEPATVEAWTTGNEVPGRTAFARMVDLFKRPSAVFFLPSPPERGARLVEFRKAPGVQGHALSPKAVVEIRKATRLQGLISTLRKEPGARTIDLPKSTAKAPADRIGESVRQWIGISFPEQVGWRDTAHALRSWRNAAEGRGILSFTLPLGKDEIRGFSSWDEYAPMIGLNSAYNEAARVFSLAHELGHLVRRGSSACLDFVSYETNEPARDPFVERWCEEFAARFLLPQEPFVESLEEVGLPDFEDCDFEVAQSAARRFKVSIRAVALRLIGLGLAPADLYSEVKKRARVVDRPEEREGGGGMRTAQRRILQLGRGAISSLLGALDAKKVEFRDVLDYLDVGSAEMHELRSAV